MPRHPSTHAAPPSRLHLLCVPLYPPPSVILESQAAVRRQRVQPPFNVFVQLAGLVETALHCIPLGRCRRVQFQHRVGRLAFVASTWPIVAAAVLVMIALKLVYLVRGPGLVWRDCL